MAKKTYSEAQLKELAKDRFERLEVVRLYATTDGNFFIMQNRAQLYAGKDGNVFEIIKEGVSKEELDAISIRELKLRIVNTKDVPSLKRLIAQEEAGANRPAAIKLIKGRIEAIGKEQAKQRGDQVEQAGSQDGDNGDSTPPEVTPLDLDKSIPNLTADLEQCEDLAILNKTLEAEKAGQNRTGAVKAIEERIKSLN